MSIVTAEPSTDIYTSLFNPPIPSHKEMLRFVLLGGTRGRVVQQRPYTMVHITAEFRGKKYSSYGFSKVMYPDVWKEEKGIEVAEKHAANKIVKQIRQKSKVEKRGTS